MSVAACCASTIERWLGVGDEGQGAAQVVLALREAAIRSRKSLMALAMVGWVARAGMG